MTVSDIPAINATLNGVASLLLIAGFILIKTGRKEAHRRVMTSACLVSVVFLIGYVSHKILVRGVHTPFGGQGLIATIYYTKLLTFLARVQGFNNIGVLHGGLLRFASKYEPAIAAAAGKPHSLIPSLETLFVCLLCLKCVV